MTSQNVENNEQLTIHMLNCNSLYNKISELKKHIQETDPDILCLCETWLHQKYVPRFFNYSSEWCHRDAAGGGLGIIIKKNIQYQNLPLIPFINGVLEIHAIKLQIKQSLPLCIANIYNPQKPVSTEELNHYLLQMGSNFILVGDFNAHSPILNSHCNRSNPTGKSIESLLIDNSICLINPLNMYTYFDKRTGNKSCLDLCLSSPNISPMISIAPHSDVGSDHLLLEVKIEISPYKYVWNRISGFKVNKSNAKIFTAHHIPSDLVQPLNMESLVTDFTGRFLQSARDSFGAPSSSMEKRNKLTPWWSEECSSAVAARRQAYKLMQNHPIIDNIIEYKKLTAKARFIIKRSKKQSMHDYISTLNHSTPQSQIWKKIRAFKSTYSPPTFPLEDANGLPILDPIDKAELMSTHLKQQYQNNSNEANFTEDISEYLGSIDPTNFLPVSFDELSTQINQLKDKAPGHDRITNKMIRLCHPEYKRELLNIFNQSLLTGDMPTDWKYGFVVLILKPQKPKQLCSSYRPISLLPCLGKLLERIVKSRLEYHLEKERLLSPSQYGFRPGRSTEDIVLELSQQIQRDIKSKKCCGVVYIDLKGAFDSVWRHGLIYKLMNMSVCGNLLKWIISHLDARSQSVVLHGAISQKANSDVGVPQGAVLSPLLFNVMMSDIPTQNDIIIYIFADDITVTCSGPDNVSIQNSLQHYLNKLCEWLIKWEFKINPTKTKMQFFTRKRIPKPVITVENQTVELVKDQRLLGIIFDAPYLTWGSHIKYLVSDCTRRIGVMRALSSTKYGASFVVLRRFYIAYIRSKLSYCSTSFRYTSNTNLNHLNKIQNACLRLMLGARKSSPILSMEKECSIPPLKLYFEYLGVKKYTKMMYDPDHFTKTNELLSLEVGNIFLQSSEILSDSFNMPASMKRNPIANVPSLSPSSPISSKIVLSPTIDMTEEAFTDHLILNYDNYTHLYTDGSKCTDCDGVYSVAAGLFIPARKWAISWKLNPYHTVVAAEMFAIWMSLVHIKNAVQGDCVIFTDSKTVLQILLSNKRSYAATSDQIRTILCELNCSRNVHLHWVKAHVGISGNEGADKVANLGHSGDRSVLYKLHKEELYAILKQGFLSKWEKNWNEECTNKGKGLFLRSILCNFQRATPVNTGNRFLDTKIFRLRLGHVGLNSWLYRFNLTNSAACPHCGGEETIEHLILRCRTYAAERSQLFIDIVMTTRKIRPLTLKLVLGGENFDEDTNRDIIGALGMFLRSNSRLEAI